MAATRSLRREEGCRSRTSEDGELWALAIRLLAAAPCGSRGVGAAILTPRARPARQRAASQLLTAARPKRTMSRGSDRAVANGDSTNELIDEPPPLRVDRRR